MTRVNLDASRRRATGVTYVDAQGTQVEQPAKIVILTAFQLHNVRLLLLSVISTPYDPATGQGVVGKNFAYQMLSSVNVTLPASTEINEKRRLSATAISTKTS